MSMLLFDDLIPTGYPNFIQSLRQIAAVFLLLIALLHLGVEPLAALTGHPIDLESGCGSGDHDEDGDDCCFCCCSHVLPQHAAPLLVSVQLAAQTVTLPHYHPGQIVRPHLLPPRQ